MRGAFTADSCGHCEIWWACWWISRAELMIVIVFVGAAMPRHIPIGDQVRGELVLLATTVLREKRVRATIYGDTCPPAITLHTVQARYAGTANREADDEQ
jgi:hypothetical protein